MNQQTPRGRVRRGAALASLLLVTLFLLNCAPAAGVASPTATTGGPLAPSRTVARTTATGSPSPTPVPDATATRAPAPPVAEATERVAPRLLIFSRTLGFRHDSIAAGIARIQQIGQEEGWTIEATEDSTWFTDNSLARYDAVIFLSTTGDVLDAAQQGAFERYIQGGGGYAGIHAASDTEYDWPWYGGLVGAYFDSHPAIQQATVNRVDGQHPSTVDLPELWTRTDEWYNFQSDPTGVVQVLLALDENSYSGGSMGASHPISWSHLYEGGRSWYTGMGHTVDSFDEPLFVSHLRGGLRWVVGGETAATYLPLALASGP